MSDDKTIVAPEPRLTLDDLRHQAESVKSKALADTKAAVDNVVHQEATRTLIIMAGVVVAAACISYFLGSRSGRAAAPQATPGE